MRVYVKMPHTKIDITGDIPEELLSVLKKVYGKKMTVADDEYVNIRDTDWFKKIDGKMTPGRSMANYRKLMNLTQTQLGEMLGGIPKQNISQMERDVRPISKKTAKLLAALYKVSVENFI